MPDKKYPEDAIAVLVVRAIVLLAYYGVSR